MIVNCTYRGTMYILLLFAIGLLSTVKSYSFDQPEVFEKSGKEILKQLINEIKELKTDRDFDRERIRILETDRDVDKERIRELEADRDSDRKKKEVLDRTVADQNDIIVSLLQFVKSDAVENTRYSSKHNQTTPQTNEHYRKTDSITQPTHKETKRIATGQPVAFSAYLKPNVLDHLGAHQNIVFDQTFTNLDNVYNVHHGVFSVPLSGTYVITSTVLASNNREVWCDIVVNGNVKAHVYARGTDGRHDQGSQTIVLHLNQGDDVSIQNEATDDALWGDAYTTFSGFLLFEEEPVDVVG